MADAVHKLQLALLDGIRDEGQLFAAGSLMSRSDYEDLVTERSIANVCGYPLCPNSLPSEKLRKGHYRISLKEHKVYDLHETYMYCSSSCLINSRAFAGSLQDERCLVMNPAKVNEILSLFDNLGLESEEETGQSGDLGISKLRIQEKAEIKGGEVAMEEWMGPSNAIEGYVPQRDRNLQPSSSKTLKKGSEPGDAKLRDALYNVGDFKVTLLSNGDSKSLKSNVAKEGSKPKRLASKKGTDSILDVADLKSTIITQDEYNSSKLPLTHVVSDPNKISSECIGKTNLGPTEVQIKPSAQSEKSIGLSVNGLENSTDSVVIGTKIVVDGNSSLSSEAEVSYSCQSDVGSSSVHVLDDSGADVQSSKFSGKSSLKTYGIRKATHSVTWADEKKNGVDSGSLCEVKEFKTAEGISTLRSIEAIDNDEFQRFASAQACAMALSQAAEAVASGQSYVTDPVSEVGIIVLPRPDVIDEGLVEEKVEGSDEDDGLEDTPLVKWAEKSDNFNSDAIGTGNSWFGTPPEGFGLNLSPFATMWNTLFSWTTSSSLAYIYGRDESCHEEYIFVNGREYPNKVVFPDGRSSEIKQTLAGCLARALPGVIVALKLPTPVSTLEQGMSCFLETMSFMDALPSFRVKQWQVIVLLFINALSVCRIPGLTPYLTSRRVLIPKVLEGAQISTEEYEIMKDLVIPLGRVPQFSMQSGG